MSHQLQPPAQRLLQPCFQFPGVSAVGSDALQKGEFFSELGLEQQLDTGAVLDVSRTHPHLEQQPSESVSVWRLRPLSFLEPKAVRASLLGGLDRLAVHDGGAERLIAASLKPHGLAQTGIEPLEKAAQALLGAKGPIDRGPVGQIVREHAPDTAGADYVEAGEESGSVQRSTPLV